MPRSLYQKQRSRRSKVRPRNLLSSGISKEEQANFSAWNKTVDSMPKAVRKLIRSLDVSFRVDGLESLLRELGEAKLIEIILLAEKNYRELAINRLKNVQISSTEHSKVVPPKRRSPLD